MLPLLIIGSFCCAFFIAWVLNWLALIPWRRSVGQHWTERARLLFPARVSARVNNILIPSNLCLLSWLFLPESNLLLIGLSGFVSAVLAGYFMSREVFVGLRFKLWLNLVLAGLGFVFAWWLVLAIAILEMPENFGLWTWLAVGCVLVIFLAFQFGFGIQLLTRFRVLKPATEHLQTLVTEVSQKMAVPVRSTWILSTHLSNAMALPLTRELIFTDRLLATLSDDEIKAIAAHELGHLNEPRRVLFVRFMTAGVLLPLIFARPMGAFSEHGTAALLFLVSTVAIILGVGIRVAKRMEKRADKIAAENLADTAVYARALETAYRENQMPAVMARRSSNIHPDLYDRMTTAGVTPDFPKPAPAKGQAWTSFVMCFGLILLIMVKASAVFLNALTIHVR